MEWQHRLQKPLFAKEFGQQAERLSIHYLKKHKLKLITHNFHSRFGEIDIIMHTHDSLVFIEVKARKALSLTSPLESISHSKITKLKKTAAYFIMTNKQYHTFNCRFDVVAITNHGMILDFLWLKSAFT